MLTIMEITDNENMLKNSLGYGIHVSDILDRPFHCLAAVNIYTRMSSLKSIGNQFLQHSLDICMGLRTGIVDYNDTCGFQFTDYIIMNLNLDDLSFIPLFSDHFNEILQYFFRFGKMTFTSA